MNGEFDLIRRIRELSEPSDRVLIGIGDDCASLRFTPGREVLVTTDMLMEGRHFRLGEATAEEVGYKCLAVNLSDIAAMAGTPIAAVVSVALPRGSAEPIALAIRAGMAPLCDRFEIPLVGGDTNVWDGPLVVSVTLLGEVDAGRATRRSGAHVGDSIFVTGPLGGSLLGRHLRPQPRVFEASLMSRSAEIHAMIDISDGLSSDLGHILDESGVGAILDASLIPIHDDARTIADRDGRSPIDHALNDGEDFELCLTANATQFEALSRAAPGLRCIGEIVKEPGLRLRLASGSVEAVFPGGFDHLSQEPGLESHGIGGAADPP